VSETCWRGADEDEAMQDEHVFLWRAMLDTAGFDVSAARLRVGFVPLSSRRGGHDHRDRLADWLDYYTRDKVLFRFTRPPQP
jgi:hypothetical protein